MLIIPAIDIRDGKCVRLQQGVFSRQTIYAEDPVAVALSFQQAGAQRLHIVDLDGAKSGGSRNASVVERIVADLRIPVQLGGGMRSMGAIERWLNSGIDRVVVGTLAVTAPEIVKAALETFGPARVVLALDARDGMVAVEGWQRTTEIRAAQLAEDFKLSGLERILYTDIARDGMFSGPDIDALKEIAVSTGLKTIASGGISDRGDLDAVSQLEPFGVDSVIVGRAFYEGRLSAQEVL